MLTAQQVEQFQQDGFLKSGRVLSDEQVDELREELARVIRDADKEDVPQPRLIQNLSEIHSSKEFPVWQIANIWEASPAFAKLTCNPVILEEIAQLTGADELRVWHDQIQYKPARKGGVNPWHQDAPKWRVLQPKTQVSAWVALDDVDEANGCMSMVKGTHQIGDCIDFLATVKDFDSLPSEHKGHRVEIRLCPVGKGEVHYHHGMVWHGSHANASHRERRAIAVHYMTGETRYDANGGQHSFRDLIRVADGEKIVGGLFPLVWQKSSDA